MNRSHNFINASEASHSEIGRKTVIHEAGHAAAIYLGNKQKGLPPVFFQIFIQPDESDFRPSGLLDERYDRYIAKVEGGRLIHTLPSSIDDATKNFSGHQKYAYKDAFEADIINLLVGPLAEAKYVALRDDELINPRLVNVNALHYYGGTSDLEAVNEYLQCFIDSNDLKERKMTELFLAAFSFVSERSNWRAITALADYILTGNKSLFECDEIISVLESASHCPLTDSIYRAPPPCYG